MTRRDIALAFVPPLCWGAGFTIAKPAVTHFPPLFMMALIYGAIALLLMLTLRDRITTGWGRLALIAAFGVTIQGALTFWGLRELPASTAALLIQIQVPFAVLLGWLFGSEELNGRKLTGTAIACAGVAMVIGLPDVMPPLLPALLVIGGAAAWAFGQVLAARLGRDSGFLLLKGNALAALPQLVAASLLLESGQADSLAQATAIDWLALGFVAVIGFYLAYATWFSLLLRCRMDEVAPFTLLMPVVGLATSALLLGERIGLAQIAGGSVILVGLAVVVGPRLLRARTA